METIGLDTVVVQRTEPVAVELEGTVVMMSLEQGKYYGLDAVGTRIWELMAEPRTVSEICDRLVEEFDVDRETCVRDVLEFLNELAAEKLVDRRDGPAA